MLWFLWALIGQQLKLAHRLLLWHALDIRMEANFEVGVALITH